MKEVLKCPNCGQPTIKERRIYPPEEIKEISLGEYAERVIKREKAKSYEGDCAMRYSSGDICVSFSVATQIVFECSTCGYTKVYDV
jgi:predicted nucleic-acid-binding Zn-ribbon protein